MKIQISKKRSRDSLRMLLVVVSTSRRRHSWTRTRMVSPTSFTLRFLTDFVGNAVARLTYRLHLPPFPQHSPTVLSTLALIKTSPTLDSLLPLGSQLHFALLSSSASAPMLVQDDGTPSGASTVVTTPSAQSTPYDGLHSLVHWGVAPWFDSYVNSKQGLTEVVASNKKGNEAQMGEFETLLRARLS